MHRNARVIENGILLNRDTNTIEALAALHISGPHMMHTEGRPARHGAETVDVGNHAAPVTIRRKRHGRDRDSNNPERCPRVIVRKGRGTEIQYRERYRHRHYTSHRGKKGRRQPASGERKRL